MKSVCMYIVTIMLFASTAFSAESAVDFDGKNKEGKDIINHLNETTDNLITSSFSEVKEIITPSENDTSGIATIRLIEITESGEKVVEPIITADGKKRYEYRPNAHRYWELKCESKKNRAYWNASLDFYFNPRKAGHKHTPWETLSYLHPRTGELLPNPIEIESRPVNTPYHLYYKAPCFSTFVLVKAEFYGACQDIITADVDIKVTVENVTNIIKLEELTKEPYFAFKKSPSFHPSNHFATKDTIDKWKNIAWEYYEIYHPSGNEILTITDIGLPWGGRYYVYGENVAGSCWTEGRNHTHHRYGRQIDVRSKYMPKENYECFKEIC